MLLEPGNLSLDNFNQSHEYNMEEVKAAVIHVIKRYGVLLFLIGFLVGVILAKLD